jgi:transcription elongation factor GreA
MEKVAYITKEGLEKLEIELDELVRVRRKEIATRIQEAKELGDLSENAEYQEAKNEQAFNEGRIEDLENTIKHAQIIESDSRRADIVQVGSTAQAKNGSDTATFYIVGSNEADPLAGRISNESPLGKALIGKRLNDIVSVAAPKGNTEYTIVHIG